MTPATRSFLALLRRRGAASLLVLALLVGAASLAVTGSRVRAAQQALPEVLVYKTPTCGCCGKWVDHLRANGFKVNVVERDDLGDIRREWKVPRTLASCHTARIGRYVVEGHVPAADIRKLLANQPRVDGLSVPGMPIGSPGMEQGDTVEPYDVLAFNAAGETTVFARHDTIQK